MIAAFVVAAMRAVSPGDAVVDLTLAEAIAIAADESSDPERTAVALVVTAHGESRLGRELYGDRDEHDVPRSCGYFHLWVGPSERRCALVLRDPVGSARMARDLLAWSERACSDQPAPERWAAYVSGSCARGTWIARDRWYTARRVFRDVRSAS